jgi:phage tail sheath protein FI
MNVIKLAQAMPVEVVGSGSCLIIGASTSITAFVGLAAAGPYNEAVAVCSFSEFTAVFGGYLTEPRQYLAYAVELFFKNGGEQAYIVRAAQAPAPAGELSLSGPAENEKIPAGEELVSPDYDAALAALETVEDISILAVPGAYGADIYSKMIGHCHKMKYRFAILDLAPNLDTGQIKESRAHGMNSPEGYAAVYYPWLKVACPVSEEIVSVPPSGAIAGVFARVAATRGVHKAPANEEILGIAGLDVLFNAAQQQLLNLNNVNVICLFPDKRHMVWGARTIAEDPTWKYVNIRRLLFFIEQSIFNSMRCGVCGLENENLCGNVKKSISEFLLRLWKDGFLLGAVSEEAFYVKCDSSQMAESGSDSGTLLAEIGVAVARPGEFVVSKMCV